MKHNIKITLILLGMFLITQFIGIYVVQSYSQFKYVDGERINTPAISLPYGLETPDVEKESDFLTTIFPSIIFAFILAIMLFFILTKIHSKFIIKLWFLFVVSLALAISFNVFLSSIIYSSIIALIISIPLAYFKVYKQNFLIHNFTELFIYPGIAAIFVPLLNFYSIVVLLILISIYDMWAVWHSGIMQKMAKYQMNELKIFSGFFVPYLSKKLKEKIKKMKKSSLKKSKIKVNVAILGGGDVVFPIITAGVMLLRFGIMHSLFVIFGATLGLSYLFFFAKKKKFYPAMPFITAGIFLGMILSFFLGYVF
jgi:presenilin-like A22 family membrane protease